MSYEVQDFGTQVLERSKQIPVLVDFWAPWCAPCRALGPVLERMVTQANGQWELVKVNTEENQEIVATFNIASIPTVKLFVNGAVVSEFVEALPEREIHRFLEQAFPSPKRFFSCWECGIPWWNASFDLLAARCIPERAHQAGATPEA